MPSGDDAKVTQRKKKLLVISQYFPVEPGGAEHQVYYLTKHFRSEMEVHYLTISDDGLESGDANIRISTIPQRKLLRRVLGLYYVLDYFRVMKAIRRIRPDFIYLRDARAYLGMAARYVLTSECTLIWHISSENQLRRFQRRSLRTVPFDYIDKKITEYGIRHASHIFGQTKYEDELLQRNYGRKCDLIVGNWHPEPAGPCVKGSPVKVVWVANVKPVKKPEVFLDLAEQFRNRKEVEFIMVGRPGPARYQGPLESRIRSVRNLKYLGEKPVEEINRILAESHVFVNTSEYEGFPNTFIQAWLHEVPVVSLHVDPDDILKREQLGFHSRTFDGLVRDTQNLIHDSELRMHMGRRAKAYALENHSLTKNLGMVAEFLQA